MLNKQKNKYKKIFDQYLGQIKKKIKIWTSEHYLQLAIFNAIILALILLRSAGYFQPVLDLSINLIFLVAILLLVILLNANSQVIFLIAVAFLILAVPFKYFTYLEVWAERTVVYAFQALLIGSIMMVIEILRSKNE